MNYKDVIRPVALSGPFWWLSSCGVALRSWQVSMVLEPSPDAGKANPGPEVFADLND